MRFHFFGVGLCLTTLVSISSRAEADSTSSALAEALFQDASRLMETGRIEEACGKLEHSYELEPLPGTLLRMALCHELQNKTATAYLEFSRGLAWARRDGRQDRIAFAQTHLDGLKPRLALVSVHLPPALAARSGVMVYLNGVHMPASAWGVPTPVDPGQQVVKVAAEGHADAVTHAHAEPGTTVTVTAPTPVAKSTVPAAREGTRAPRLGAAWAAAGVGVTALAVGGFYGLRAINRSEDAKDRCGAGPLCADEAGLAANAEARSAARVANIAAAVSVIGLGTAGLLVWWRQHSLRPRIDMAVVGLPGGGGGVIVGGRL